MKTALMLTLTLATLSQTALADSYQCRVREALVTANSHKEKACGDALLDTEKSPKAYFDCAGGVSVELRSTLSQDGKFITLSQLEAGSASEWESREQKNSASIGVSDGEKAIYMDLRVDTATAFRKKKTEIQLNCYQAPNS